MSARGEKRADWRRRVINVEDRRKIEEFLGVRIVEAYRLGDCYMVLERGDGSRLVIGFNELGMWTLTWDEWLRLREGVSSRERESARPRGGRC